MLLPGAGTAALLVFAFLLATFPSERLDAALYGAAGNEGALAWPHHALFEGRVDPASRRPTSLWSNVLVLPGLNTDASGSATGPQLSLRLRHLEGAVLIGADLRRIDLTAAKLRAARLGSADLRDANFGCQLQELADVANEYAKGEYCADLEEAGLDHAKLSGAQLNYANMPKANLQQSHLDGAVLRRGELAGRGDQGATLDGAALGYAHLDGADLSGASLRGASLDAAQMAGSSLTTAHLEGATLDEADLSGADLRAVRLDAASLYRTRLIAASLYGASLSGAFLDKTELLAARLDVRSSEAASLNGVVVGLAELPGAFGQARILSLQTEPQVYTHRIGSHDPRELVLRDWSAEDYAVLLATADSFPRNGFGDEARNRVAKLDPSAQTQEDPSARDVWKRLEDSSLSMDEFRRKRTEVLSSTACAPEGAPFVAAALINRIDANRIDAQEIDAKALAGKLLDEANCPGAHGLPEPAQRILRNLVQTAPD